MKMQLNSVIGLTLVLFTTGNVWGQSADVARVSPPPAKKVYYSGNEYAKNVRVDRAFAKNFSDAKDVRWKETEKEYIADFKMEDRFAVAWFTKGGGLRCVNYYGDGKHLPKVERGIVLEKYAGYDIIATIEIDKNDVKAYIVTLQSCSNVKKLKVIDGEVEEMETMRLAR